MSTTLTARASLRAVAAAAADDVSPEPEDYMSESLGVIFPGDATDQHGDADHGLVYASPRLARPLELDLADPRGESERRLFSHYLWNASLLLAELVERDSLDGGGGGGGEDDNHGRGGGGGGGDGGDDQVRVREEEEKVDDDKHRRGRFDVRQRSVLELGAGTALPSIVADLVGAARVTVTDYPSDAILATLRANVARNTTPAHDVAVHGHAWGQVDDAFARAHAHAYDRVLACDCLWMPWQHANLRRSLAHFLRRDDDDAAPAPARCWLVAGFHTGRGPVSAFFAPDALADAGLALDDIWERDGDGRTRPWDAARDEDVTARKSWLVVAVLKRAAA